MMSAASCVVTYLVQEHGPAVQSLAQVPMGLRITNAIVSYGGYLLKSFWPVNLAVYYPHPYDSLPLWLVAICFVLLLSVTIFLISRWKHFPYALVGWLWFLGTLVPVIGLVQVGGQAMADRYTYVPLVGLCIAVVWAVTEGVQRRPFLKKLTAVGAGLVILVLGSGAWKQIGYWKDSMTLFGHALAVTTGNQLAHNQLGFALNKEKRYDEAITHLREALRITPQYVGAHINLGNALKEKGALDEAAKQYKEALRYDPRHVTAMNNLGILLAMKGKLDEAMALFSNALKIDPDNVRAHNNLGIAFAQTGNHHEAVKHFKEALRLDPSSISAQKNLERARKEKSVRR
jgi:Flp pilus assembly protein TadD